ncbi:hypothetical protein ACJZ2D_013769 [Fusarium nematophilum]
MDDDELDKRFMGLLISRGPSDGSVALPLSPLLVVALPRGRFHRIRMLQVEHRGSWSPPSVFSGLLTDWGRSASPQFNEQPNGPLPLDWGGLISHLSLAIPLLWYDRRWRRAGQEPSLLAEAIHSAAPWFWQRSKWDEGGGGIAEDEEEGAG